MNYLLRVREERQQKKEGLRIAHERLVKLREKEDSLPLLPLLEGYELKELEKVVDHMKHKQTVEETIQNLSEQLSELQEVIRHLKQIPRYKEGEHGT